MYNFTRAWEARVAMISSAARVRLDASESATAAAGFAGDEMGRGFAAVFDGDEGGDVAEAGGRRGAEVLSAGEFEQAADVAVGGVAGEEVGEGEGVGFGHGGS